MLTLLQSRLWAIMDYMKANHPLIYGALKSILKPTVKRILMWVLTLQQMKTIENSNKNEGLLNDRVKISFIILSNDDRPIYIPRIFNTLFFPSKKTKEIIVVSDTELFVDGVPKNKIKFAASLSDAILDARGNYLCFIDKDESFSRMGLRYLYKMISKTKNDLYFGNFIDKSGEMVKVYNHNLKYDFSKAALPILSAFGPKVISKELAIRVRLPRERIYSYLLEASDKISNFRYIEYPIIHSNMDTKGRALLEKDLLQLQIETLKRRYIYNNKAPVKEIKKVLFIVPSVVIGGAEKVLLDLSGGLIKHNIKVDVFCTHKGGEWKDEFEKIGVKVCVSKEQNDGKKIEEIDKLVRKNRYDVIHTSNTEYGYLYAPKMHELPYRPIFIDTIHSQNNPLVRVAITHQSYIDKIITVNNYIRKILGENSIEIDRMVPVLNGIDAKANASRDVLSRFKDVEIAFLGRMSNEKNPLQFIKIAKVLSEKHNDWKFKIIGDGPLLSKAKQYASSLGLSKNISFLGSVKDGASELASASCCAITSYTEGLPIVLLEALGMGIPVVGSNVGGIHEVLIDNENGFLVDNPDDTDEYARKIEELFLSTKKYEKYSSRAVELVSNNTVDNMTKGVISVYLEAVKSINNKFNKLTTIAMLSFNREDAIKRTLETIYKNTEVPFNVLVLDNGSEKETTSFLNNFTKTHNNFSCIFEKKNLGCPGGRHKMLKMIKSDYIVTIDNDMEVPKFWLRDLIIRMEEDKKIMGVCVKDVFPWGKVEFTGGKIDRDDKGFYLFNAVNYNKSYDDLSTLEEIECDWLPGGATLWRGNIHKIAEHSLEYVNAFEDFDYSLQLSKKGYRTVNCPNVMFIHHHASGFGKKQRNKEAKYISDRNNENGFIISLAAFFRRTGYIMRNDKIYSIMDIKPNASPNEVSKIVEKYALGINK